MSQHIERDHFSQKIKIDFLPFPKWLFFQLNFGAMFFKSDISIGLFLCYSLLYTCLYNSICIFDLNQFVIVLVSSHLMDIVGIFSQKITNLIMKRFAIGSELILINYL